MSATQEKTTTISSPTNDATAKAVFSNERTVHVPKLTLPMSLRPNTQLKMDGFGIPVTTAGERHSRRLP